MKDSFKLNRRSFLQGAGAVGAAALMGAPTILRAAPMKITFGHGAAPGNPRTIAADKFAELVKMKSGGALEVTVAGAAMLGDDAAMLTSLRTGTLAISANSQGATSAIVPELAALGLPFLFSKSDDGVKVLSGKIGDLLKPKFDAVGLVPIGWWDNGIRHITNSKRSINVPDDLKGLKFRTPPDPATIDIFQALGAATAQIAFSELYVALQQKVVDGQENPLTNIASAKIYEVNPFVSLSAHKWECTPVLMSKMAWNRLDAKSKEIILEAMAEATTLQIGTSNEANIKLEKDFRANSAITVNNVDLDAFRKQTASVFDKWEQKPFGAFVKDLRKTVLG
ncbi:TRAP transporter substrate-binding protein [Propionivibrio sp.]|uniref:TRAP transporter substrate-binding protein n=1 Tax=Propionivibrio sp. TaxID=2212460 RepID=UPI00272DDB80|nr:TRAP transporter substrate-binding protein [Propionivibrio sp.]